MEEIKNVGLDEFIRAVQPKENYKNQIIVMEIHGSETKKLSSDMLPLRFEAVSIILVCHGELTVTLDYLPYTLQQHMVLERMNLHLMNDFRMSHDFKGYHVLIGPIPLDKMFEEIITVPKEYGLSKRLSPVQKLDPKDFNMLVETIERLRNNMRRTDHYFQKAIVTNEIRNFIMELSNIGMQRISTERINFEFNHQQELAIRFMQLLVTRAKEWNEVSQYSTKLCVTPVYLSRTIKTLSEKTAMEWINYARVAEAKIMLRKCGNSIQEVADMLHFSDQSAFGKFFKKHTGMSPVEYKRSPDDDDL